MNVRWRNDLKLWCVDLPDGTRIYTHRSEQAIAVYNKQAEDAQPVTWRWGFLRNKHSMWMGVHYSKFNLRWCINIIPCFTIWITKPGGKAP